MSQNSSLPASPVPLAALLIGNIALAFGPWFVRAADVGPVATAFWRITLAAPLLLAMACASGWRPQRLAFPLWGVILVGGICFAADLASWHLGIVRTTLANATLIGNSASLFFPVYGFLAARALPSRAQWLALLLALVGGALLLGTSYQLDARHLAGDLLCLLAGILYTAYLIAMTRTRIVMAALPALALSTTASIVPLFVFAFASGDAIWPGRWDILLRLALVSQVLGQGMMIYALGRLSPLAVGIAFLSQPIVAGTVGWIIYGERLGLADLVGAALVAAALVLVRRAPPLAPAGVAARQAAGE